MKKLMVLLLGHPRTRCCDLPALLIVGLGVVFLLVGAAQAQVYELRGGSSTLFGASGGAVNVYGARYGGAFSLGFLDGPRVGLLARTAWHGLDWSAGDQLIPFALPTDQINQSYSFWGRGLGAAHKDAHGNWLLYAGSTSTGFVVPFLSVARTEAPAALAFYERQLSPSVRFASHNIVSSQQTSIHSLEWQARKDLKLAFAAGVGSNAPYASSNLRFNRDWVSLQAGYAEAGRNFRRARLESPLVTESDRENIQLDLIPVPNLRFTLSRQNLLVPISKTQNTRASVNGLGAWGSVRGFQLRSSMFESENSGRESRVVSFGGGRSLFERLTAGLDYFRSIPTGGPPSSSVAGSLRETLTRRIRTSQLISHSDGQTSVAMGGGLLTNVLNISAEYQTIYVPFTQPGKSPFKQALVVNLRLQLPRSLALEGATNISPLGQVRYTVDATGFAYGNGESGAGAGTTWKALQKYVVTGRVVNETGEPISGAALEACGQLMFSDSDGIFLLRLAKEKECPLRVLLDQFMQPGRYEVLSAPETVKSSPDERAQPYTVKLRRLPSTPSHP